MLLLCGGIWNKSLHAVSEKAKQVKMQAGEFKDDARGRPTLDQNIRQANRNLVIHLRDTRDPLYDPIEGYLNYVNNCCRDGRVAEYYKDWKRQHHRP